jgi:hypothetical protein
LKRDLDLARPSFISWIVGNWREINWGASEWPSTASDKSPSVLVAYSRFGGGCLRHGAVRERKQDRGALGCFHVQFVSVSGLAEGGSDLAPPIDS